MEKRKLGKTDLQVSVLGFGGAEIGFDPTVTPETVSSLLNEALDSGLNLIDTASAYLESEKLIGQALKSRRKDFYLSTKCGPRSGFSQADWSEKGLLEQIGQSLKILQTDYIDIMLLHSCDVDKLQHGEVVTALQKARQKGYIRYMGYSGDNGAAETALEMDVFDVLETSINIADQEAIDLLLPMARERQVGVIAKRPLANAAWKTGKKPEMDYHHEYWERLLKLDYDFLKKPLPEAISVALRFTLSQPGVHSAIVGTIKPGRYKENAQALAQGPLSKSVLDSIHARWDEIAAPDWVGQN